MLCVLVVGGISTVEAVHVHGEWLPKNTAVVTSPAIASQGQGEEHCPLCVAMHSTLPATLQVVPEPVQESATLFTTSALIASRRRWSFAMFSRPPPFTMRTHVAGDVLPAAMTAG
jgi:hypothetical protein